VTQLKHRRLAGTVRTDQRRDLPTLGAKGEVVDRDEAAKNAS